MKLETLKRPLHSRTKTSTAWSLIGRLQGLSILHFDTTVRARIYEAIGELNKLRLQTVGNMHDGKNPFNQSRGTNMKKTRLVKLLAAGAAAAIALITAFAQESSTTTTTTSGTTGGSE